MPGKSTDPGGETAALQQKFLRLRRTHDGYLIGSALLGCAAGALRRSALCDRLLGRNILMGGVLTAVERPKAAISISVGRGLAFQAGALLLLAAAVGGTGIWFAPVISEALCAVMAVWFLRQFLRETAV